VRSEGFYVNEKSTDTSWDRTSDLPICSTEYIKRYCCDINFSFVGCNENNKKNVWYIHKNNAEMVKITCQCSKRALVLLARCTLFLVK
jgi:hypothetical protein